MYGIDEIFSTTPTTITPLPIEDKENNATAALSPYEAVVLQTLASFSMKAGSNDSEMAPPLPPPPAAPPSSPVPLPQLLLPPLFLLPPLPPLQPFQIPSVPATSSNNINLNNKRLADLQTELKSIKKSIEKHQSNVGLHRAKELSDDLRRAKELTRHNRRLQQQVQFRSNLEISNEHMFGVRQIQCQKGFLYVDNGDNKITAVHIPVFLRYGMPAELSPEETLEAPCKGAIWIVDTFQNGHKCHDPRALLKPGSKIFTYKYFTLDPLMTQALNNKKNILEYVEKGDKLNVLELVARARRAKSKFILCFKPENPLDFQNYCFWTRRIHSQRPLSTFL